MNADERTSGEADAAAVSRAARQAAAAWVARRDAGLNAAKEREFARWRAADPRHEVALAACAGAWSALAAPQRQGIAGELEEELARLAQTRRRRRQVVGSAVAAALVLLVIAGVLAWTPRVASGDALPSTVAVLRPRVETLPDGSRVELNAGAEIEVRFSAQARRVALRRGEAHFAVQKDAARPFIVAAEGVEVRAVGTAFNVQLAAAGVTILVTEGTVAVEKAATGKDGAGRDAGVSPAEPARAVAVLTVGQQIELDRSGDVSSPSPVSADESAKRLAWREARVEFTRTPLPEAVAMLNRYSSPGSSQLVADDPALAEIQVTGVFRPDNIAGFVHLIETGFGVRTERAGDTITLRAAR